MKKIAALFAVLISQAFFHTSTGKRTEDGSYHIF